MGILDFLFGKREKAALWYDQGNASVRSGDFEGAIACYDKAIAIDPEFEMAWMNKGNALNALNYPEEGLRCFDRALEINPRFALAWYNRGLALHTLGRFKEAIESYNKTLQINSHDAEAWVAKGSSLSKLDYFRESIECYDEALSINPRYALAFYNKGVSLNALGLREEAITCYDRCLEIDSNHVEAKHNKGASLYELGRFEEAIESFASALKINPQFAEAWNSKGNALMDLGQIKEAGKCYVAAVKFKPAFAEAHFNLARYYQGSAMDEEAIREYKEAIRIKPDYARAYLELGHVYTLQNKFEEAQSCFESAIQYKPEWAPNIQNILKKREQASQTRGLSGYAEMGLKAFTEENYPKAIEHFTKALEQPPDWEELFYIYWFMGGSLRRVDRLDEAIQSLTNALNCSQNRAKEEVAKVYNDLAITLEKKQLYHEAVKAQEEAIKCRPDYIRAYIHRAEMYLYLKEGDKSIADASKVLKLASDKKAVEDITIPFGFAIDETPIATFYSSDAYRILGFAYWSKGEYGEAESHFRQALEKNPHNLWVQNALEEVKKKGDFSVYLTSKSVLEDEINKAKEHSISPKFHQDDKALKILWEEYDTMLTEGTELMRSGRFDEAIKLFERARSQLPQNGAEHEMGQCENLISLTLMEQGKYEEALALNRKVLRNYQEIGVKHGEASILTNQGLILNYYDKFSEAIEVIKNAITLCQAAGNMQGTANNLGNLGISYMQLGDIAKAIKYHLEALAIDTQYNFIENTIKDKGNLASCYFSLMLTAENDAKFNEYRSQAAKYQNDIVDYYKRVRIDRFMEVRAVTALTKMQAEVGRRNRDKNLLEGCLSSLDEPMFLSSRIKDFELRIDIFEIKGMIYRYLAFLEDIVDMKTNHLKLSEKFLREANSRLLGGADARYQLAKTYQALADAEIDKQPLRLNQSFICFEEAINDIDRHRGGITQQELKMSFIGSHAEMYNDSINLCLNMHKNQITPPVGNSLEKAFEYVERAKSRTFIESLGITELNPPRKFEQEYQPLLAQEKECLTAIRSIQARQYQIHDESHFIFHEQLREYWKELEKIYDEMENISPEIKEYVFLRRGKPLNFEELKECLKENIVLVEYFTTPERTLIFIIKGDSDKPTIQEVPINQAEVRKLINTNFGEQNKFEYLDVDFWQEQCECFIEPIIEYLDENEIVYFIPHGLLHYLPLHALKVKDQYLIKKHPVLYSPSASVIKYCQTKRQNKRDTCLIFGDSLGDLNLARKEAENIAQLFGSKAYLQNEATLQTFRKEAAGKDIIHLACHGEFKKSQPLESGIKLSDGDLTAREIFNMELNADIVVLSACESGINDQKPGDELIGLTRALIYAGTPSVLVSLWKVDDEATGFLMKSFYKHLLGRDGRKKVSKVEALQKAQKETMAENTEWEHPYYWSSFVLVGDWL